MPTILTKLSCLRLSLCVAVLATVFAAAQNSAAKIDTDRDGLPDELERYWGTDPAVPDLPAVIYTFPERDAASRAKPGYDPALDPQELAVTHIAEDRYLWRVAFAADVKSDECVLHLYLDSDGNQATGRQSGGPVNGTDHMISFNYNATRMQLYPPDGGRPTPVKPPYHYVDGKYLYLLTDLAAPAQPGLETATMHILCHGANTADGKPSPMSTNSGGKRFAVGPIAQRPGAKIIRLTDREDLEGFDRSYGIDMIRDQLFGNHGVVFAGYDQLSLDGFEIDLFTQAHFGHLKSLRPLARAATAAPKGRFHPGFLIFDRNDGSRFAMTIQGDVKGFAPINVNNNRYWVYWLRDAIDFQGGENVEVIACGAGRHPVAGIVFFPQPPPRRDLPYNIHHLTSFCPPETTGETTVSWITEMPSPTRLEYGLGQEMTSTVEDARLTTVHRAVLTGLNPDREYTARAVGIKPDGTTYATAAFTFRPQATPPPPPAAAAERLPITVRNPHPFAVSGHPVTNGFPFPQGAIAHSKQVRLLDKGREIPAQIKTTAWWPDGSIKWILVSFLTGDIAADSSAEYTLEYGGKVSRQPDGAPLASLVNGLPVIANAAPITFNPAGELVTPQQQPCRLDIRLPKIGQLSQPETAVFSLEDNGPIRAVIKAVRQFSTPDGEPAFLLETRYIVWKNSPAVNVQQTFIVQGQQTHALLEEMVLSIPAANPAAAWTAATEKGETAPITAEGLHQHFDHEYRAAGQTVQGRLTGGAVTDGQLVSLRQFWQNYPKAFRVDKGALQLALCPDFEAGLYDAFPFEKEGHHLYFYLLNGVYKFRAGMAKTDDILLAWGIPTEAADRLARLHQRPLLAVAPPAWYCDSKVFYPLAVRNTEKFKYYEETIDRKIVAYAAAREKQRDYGLMNFGDWYGERGANWGNSEYDTQSGLLLQFVRSGNEDAFFLADDMEKHNRDVDTVHWSKPNERLSPGAVLVHQMGHVGGYYTESVPGTLGIPRAGTSVSHAWNEGHFYHYFLTGDVRSRETALAIADYYIKTDLRQPYHFVSCRNPGWHLIINASTLAATGNPYYLNASRVIIDRVLELQDKTPFPVPEFQREEGRRTHQIGGWSRMMVPGHCLCEPRHRGNANFMVAVLLAGMKYYHDVTGDPKVKDSIIAGAKYMIEECYSEETGGFRYTSCPNMRFSRGTHPLMVEGIARAYLWTRDPILKKPLTDALLNSHGGGNYGKSFSNYYRVAPRVLYDLAETGITWNDPPQMPKNAQFKPPAWMTGEAAKGQIMLEAEAFTGQGVGTCQARTDRMGISNAIITYWEIDIGHWLEWTFELPKAGAYQILFRYATNHKETIRKVEINGQTPSTAAASLAFARTGSYGFAAADWRFLPLPDDAGKPLVVTLPAGKNTIRMTNLNGGLALDFILLKPEK
ncbi:MAG: hypothetical protein ACOX6W_08075 [Lentisphaeria bacterium]|jgi:hypothetical protein